ncbi:hypothetical protein J3E68DRAFT_390326 [Trichoderma sp. SZMC 28012]
MEAMAALQRRLYLLLSARYTPSVAREVGTTTTKQHMASMFYLPAVDAADSCNTESPGILSACACTWAASTRIGRSLAAGPYPLHPKDGR